MLASLSTGTTDGDLQMPRALTVANMSARSSLLGLPEQSVVTHSDLPRHICG